MKQQHLMLGTHISIKDYIMIKASLITLKVSEAGWCDDLSHRKY